MIIVKRSAHGYAQDPTKNFGFEKFDGLGNPNIALVIAGFERIAGWKEMGLSEYEIDMIKDKKIVRLEFEEPNKFFVGEDFDFYDHEFYKIFTLCPYTAEFLNLQQGVQKRVPIFFPFNINHVPSSIEKKYDVIYTGHIVSKQILRDIKTISNFNYRLVSNSKHSLVTDRGVDYEKKISLISQTRITIVHNLLYPSFCHLRNVWKYPKWKNNKAFNQLPSFWHSYRFLTKRDSVVVPQLKSRAFEAAFSRSLILCKKDSFNIIEHYFEPDKEFIYYKEGQLMEVVFDILQSYDSYQSIIDNAFERAKKEYTTEVFFDKYLRNIE